MPSNFPGNRREGAISGRWIDRVQSVNLESTGYQTLQRPATERRCSPKDQGKIDLQNGCSSGGSDDRRSVFTNLTTINFTIIELTFVVTVTESMKFGDPMNHSIPSKGALRQAKLEATDEELKIAKDANIWESLDTLAEDPEHKEFIQDVGYNKAHWMHNQIQSVSGTAVSIDATSSLVKRIRKGVSSALFLFVIVCHIGDLIVPLGQLLTEKQDANFITYWLNSWVAAGNLQNLPFVCTLFRKHLTYKFFPGAKIPRCVVTDRSKALENAISMAFNLCTFGKYNEKCLKLLLGGARRVRNLKCWIRNDIAHLIKSVTRWDCWKKTKDGKDQKYFYLMLIGYLTTIRDFNVFVKVFTSLHFTFWVTFLDFNFLFVLLQVTKLIFKVASAELDMSEVQEARRTLLSCIENHQFVETQKIVASTVAGIEEGESGQQCSNRPDNAPERTFDEGEEKDLEEAEDEDEENEEPATKKDLKKKKNDLMSLFIDHLMPTVGDSIESKG